MKVKIIIGIVQFFFLAEALGNAQDFLKLAKDAFNNKDFSKAINYSDNVLKEKPDMPEALEIKGKSNLELERYHEALDNFNICTTIMPQESNYHYFKGFCEYKLKRFNNAMKSLDIATDLSPDNLLAYNYLGCIFNELKMYKEAKKNFDMAVDLQADLSVNMFVKSRFVEEYAQEYRYSIRLANAEIKKNPESNNALLYRGILKVMVSDNWGASLDLSEAISKTKEVNLGYFYRGYVNCNLRKFQEAVNDLHKFSQQFPREEKVHEMIANIMSLSNTKIVLPKEEVNEDPIYMATEEMPEYVGGMKEMYKFISANINYPSQAMDEEISGRVVLSFVVDAKGNIKNIEVIKPIGGGCEEEAVRVIKKMPAWKPGKMKGKPVNVKFTIPVSFSFNN
ncbi:MAG: TonB family protein [Bacteroidota bacterium]|nr:TonB family protein [Bacteroidota bacterium]